MRAEHSLLDAFAALRKAKFFSKVRAKFNQEMGHEPTSWRVFAQFKDAYMVFA